MNAQENKEIATQWHNALWNSRDLNRAKSAVDELTAPDYKDHSLSASGAAAHDALKEELTKFYNAFPDLTSAIEDIIAEGDRVALRWQGVGTHKGELYRSLPTGERVTISGIEIVRIANGKVVERWMNSDQLGLMGQINASPILA